MKKIILLSLLAMSSLIKTVAQNVVADITDEETGTTYQAYTDHTATVVYGCYTNYDGNITLSAELSYENETYTVTSLNAQAFYACKQVDSVYLPKTIEKMGLYVFSWASDLKAIYVDPENPFYSEINGVLFNKDQSTLLYYPDGKPDQSYIIPECVTTIGRYAFDNCPNLTTIEIPNTVTTLEEAAFCQSKKLISMEIPQSITSLPRAAFTGCSSLESIKFPETLKSINDEVFWGCSNLKSVRFPRDLQLITTNAFKDCDALESVYCESPNPLKTKGAIFSKFDATLYVPVGSKELYSNTIVWKMFSNIVESEELAVGQIRNNSRPVFYTEGRIRFDGIEGIKELSFYSPSGMYFGTYYTDKDNFETDILPSGTIISKIKTGNKVTSLLIIN